MSENESTAFGACREMDDIPFASEEYAARGSDLHTCGLLGTDRRTGLCSRGWNEFRFRPDKTA